MWQRGPERGGSREMDKERRETGRKERDRTEIIGRWQKNGSAKERKSDRKEGWEWGRERQARALICAL